MRAGICTVPAGDQAVGATLSAGILGALRGRAGDHAVTVTDTRAGVSCAYDDSRHFDSASIVKVITLAALLRWHQETGRPLSGWERDEATLMITQSDNDAATALWDEVGMSRLRHFLALAGMRQTGLGEHGLWGLTQVTAHDEMLLLTLLTTRNAVLSDASRAYELGLMAAVVPGQRWGTPAGAPAGVTVHVKNGWLPDGTGWHINSIGAFTGKPGADASGGKAGDYLIAVLTDRDPSEGYGIDTVEGVARVVHRVLKAAAPAVRPAPSATASPRPTVVTRRRAAWALVPALPRATLRPRPGPA